MLRVNAYAKRAQLGALGQAACPAGYSSKALSCVPPNSQIEYHPVQTTCARCVAPGAPAPNPSKDKLPPKVCASGFVAYTPEAKKACTDAGNVWYDHDSQCGNCFPKHGACQVFFEEPKRGDLICPADPSDMSKTVPVRHPFNPSCYTCIAKTTDKAYTYCGPSDNNQVPWILGNGAKQPLQCPAGTKYEVNGAGCERCNPVECPTGWYPASAQIPFRCSEPWYVLQTDANGCKRCMRKMDLPCTTGQRGLTTCADPNQVVVTDPYTRCQTCGPCQRASEGFVPRGFMPQPCPAGQDKVLDQTGCVGCRKSPGCFSPGDPNLANCPSPPYKLVNNGDYTCCVPMTAADMQALQAQADAAAQAQQAAANPTPAAPAAAPAAPSTGPTTASVATGVGLAAAGIALLYLFSSKA